MTTTGNTRFPVMQHYKPSDVTIPAIAHQRVTYDNPFGFSCWQLLRSDAVLMRARDMAIAAGVDARAELVVETLLRWKVSEQPQQQHIMLDHKSLVDSSGAGAVVNRAAIGDGLVLLVACQIIPTNEAYATYRELFTSQPVAAAIGSLVPEATTVSRTATSSGSTDAQLVALTARYGKAGEQFYNTYHNAYPVTVSAIANCNASAPTVAAESVLSDDDEPNEAANEMDVDSSVRPVAPLPPVASNEKLLRWYHDVLRSQKSRVRIVLRGYVSRAMIRSSAHLDFAVDNCLYVLDGRYVCSNPNNALDAAPAQSDDDSSSSESTSIQPTDSVSTNETSVDSDPHQQNIASYITAPRQEQQPREREQPQHVDETPHLLDLLDELSLGDITYYELDKALRHRFNLHSDLYAYWHANQALDTSIVRRYPRGFYAPARQHFKQAPGLLSTATYADYAAIGLAGLCLLASMSAALREWLLNAEAYYYRAAIHNGDPREYVARIEGFIDKCKVDEETVPTDSDLHTLLKSALADASKKIIEIDAIAERQQSAANADDDGDVESTDTAHDEINNYSEEPVAPWEDDSVQIQ